MYAMLSSHRCAQMQGLVRGNRVEHPGEALDRPLRCLLHLVYAAALDRKDAAFRGMAKAAVLRLAPAHVGEAESEIELRGPGWRGRRGGDHGARLREQVDGLAFIAEKELFQTEPVAEIDPPLHRRRVGQGGQLGPQPAGSRLAEERVVFEAAPADRLQGAHHSRVA